MRSQPGSVVAVPADGIENRRRNAPPRLLRLLFVVIGLFLSGSFRST